MQEQQANNWLPRPLRFYIGIVAVAGLVWLAFLLAQVEWELSHAGEIALFVSLIVIAGSFPLPIAPKVKTDVAATVIFAGALLFEPGIAALVAVVGISIYTVLIRFWGERLHLPWYKYPFNAGVAALFAGVASIAFESLSANRELMSLAVAAAAVSSYLVNTAMVSGAVSLQLGLNPISVWLKGNKEYGLAELSLFSFGFLGAVVYQESPGTVLALFIPVAVIYLAFSRLARINMQLEEALAKLEAIQGRIVSTAKLASIGALSLDLAHQIKNPLAILLGRLEGLQDRMESGTKERRHLDTAIDAGWRIQELTQTFSAIGHQKWVGLDICGMLDEAFGMAGIRSRKNIETRREYEQGLPHIKGNPVLIREALSNLFSNAMDAVEEEGVITVGASRANGTVVVKISDNGVGIPEDRKRHLFEPFASTKPNGQGLGLFAAKHIIEMHYGTVEVESREREGTSVIVRLPVAPYQDETEPAERSDNLLSPQSR